jgi:hypothetical protein
MNWVWTSPGPIRTFSLLIRGKSSVWVSSKDLVVSLAQIPSKNMVMDVVMADIPPKFGMLYPGHGLRS